MAKMIEFPVIDMEATGKNIRRLRMECGLTVREVQEYFGFGEPSAIYMWQRGQNLPSVDNLCALSKLFGVPMDDIIALRNPDDADGKRKFATELKKKKHTNKILFLWAA